MAGQNLGKRERTLLAVCIILGGGAVLYSLIVEPLATGWKTLNGRIEAKLSELGKDTRLFKMYEMIEEEYVEYGEFITSGRNMEEAQAAALGKIEEFSKSASCRIVNVKPRSPKKIGNYKEISFVVTAEGAIDRLSHFLYVIETSKELLRVKHFAITPRSGSPDALRGTFVISKVILG